MQDLIWHAITVTLRTPSSPPPSRHISKNYAFMLAPKDRCIIRWHNDFPIITFGLLILHFRRGQISQILRSTPFSLRGQLLIPYSNRRWLSFEFHSSRNDLKMCQRAGIVENQRCGETSSSCAPFSFSWPIIKTLLKYQCPARNERATPQKWATDIKYIWGCSCFYYSVKDTESRGNVI